MSVCYTSSRSVKGPDISLVVPRVGVMTTKNSMLLFIPMALAPNVYALIFSRLVQGTAACIEGPTAAGVVADLFPKVHRGIPMGFFVLTGQSLLSLSLYKVRFSRPFFFFFRIVATNSLHGECDRTYRRSLGRVQDWLGQHLLVTGESFFLLLETPTVFEKKEADERKGNENRWRQTVPFSSTPCSCSKSAGAKSSSANVASS